MVVAVWIVGGKPEVPLCAGTQVLPPITDRTVRCRRAVDVRPAEQPQHSYIGPEPSPADSYPRQIQIRVLVDEGLQPVDLISKYHIGQSLVDCFLERGGDTWGAAAIDHYDGIPMLGQPLPLLPACSGSAHMPSAGS